MSENKRSDFRTCLPKLYNHHIALLNLVKQFCFPESVDLSVFGPSTDWKSVYKTARQHSVQFIGIVILFKNLGIPSDIRAAWEKDVYTQTYNNIQIAIIEQEVLRHLSDAAIPVAVLKGSAAAQYYPKSKYRAAGDIDLLTKPDDFEKACLILNGMGCVNKTSAQEEERGRHRNYWIHGVEIELHRTFSVLADPKIASWMDEELYSDIRLESHFLSPLQNGIVLLEHVYQHLETGIGLRQIIDWMLYVHYCLHDDQWQEAFEEKARICGLDTLARTLTKMCQIYLGLERDGITWCDAVDDTTCAQLLDYVMESGNFGNSRGFLQTDDITLYPSIRSPLMVLQFMQDRGKKKWPVFGKYFFLRPFAWIAEGFDFLLQMMKHDSSLSTLKNAYQEGMHRKKLFRDIGIRMRKQNDAEQILGH